MCFKRRLEVRLGLEGNHAVKKQRLEKSLVLNENKKMSFVFNETGFGYYIAQVGFELPIFLLQLTQC